VLLSLRPGLGLGLEDPQGHLMKVLALGLDDKVWALALTPQVLALALALAFGEKVLARLSPKTQATWLLYVYALLTLTVSHNSLPFLV